jgi:hypothetical protein
VKRCRCGERQRAKSGGCRNLAHTRWNGGRGYLRSGGERFVCGRGQGVAPCAREVIGAPSMLRLIHRAEVLARMQVADLVLIYDSGLVKRELGGKRRSGPGHGCVAPAHFPEEFCVCYSGQREC